MSCSIKGRKAMGKYKYAIQKEMEWLEEEIKICEDCLNGKDTLYCGLEEVASRKRWAENELERLRMWKKDYILKRGVTVGGR